MENFIVSARKYRPDNFSTVVGQASIATTLKNSIKNNHLGHAYLFSGPRGVGKTTCARIFAKTINCFNIADSGEACNTCESCESFNDNRSYNIHELDAASNNSVDDIRNLTDQVRIPPQIGAYSIYIIDEVHMLSQQAFNAFLKTLEEPPKHAIFILATTEKHKIIPTILSRCQIYDFNRINIEDTVAYLKSIADKEAIKYEDDALQIIARKADGAMRDALSIFDQVVSFSGDFISYKAVIENLNILDFDYFFKLTDAFLANDISSSLMLFDEILKRGFDARNFINGYAEHVRDLMVCKDPQTVQLLEVGAGIKERYLAQSEIVDLEFLISSLEICNQADIQFRTSKNQRLTIELAMVKLATIGSDQKKKTVPIVESEKTISKVETEKALPLVEPEKSVPEVEKTETLPVELQKAVPVEDKLPTEESTPLQEEKVETIPDKPQTPISQPTENRVVYKGSISIKNSLKGETIKPEQSDKDFSEEPAEIDQVKDNSGFPDSKLLLKSWNDFAQSVESDNPRIFSTLKSHQPDIDSAGKMKILLNSEAQKENFVKNIKPKLINYFNKKFGTKDFIFDVIIEANNVSEKKVYTDQDKFDYLLSKNPELGKLKTLFNLDFDN